MCCRDLMNCYDGVRDLTNCSDDVDDPVNSCDGEQVNRCDVGDLMD